MENQGNKRVIIGVFLIALGVIFFADNFDIIPSFYRRVLFSWQTFLIALGSFFLLSDRKRNTGIILIAIGGFFILPKIFPFPFNFRQLFWPVILLAVGISILVRHRKKPHGQYFTDYDMDSEINSEIDYVDEIAIFGGNKKRINSDNFCGGKITTIFGGTQINLRKASLADGYNELNLLTIFGGTEINVPNDWNVKIDVVAIFGSLNDKRNIDDDLYYEHDKTLHIKGIVLFGGGDIKS